MLEINTDNFPKLIVSEQPLVIDFWAEWCGPCKAIAPMMEEFAREYEGRVNIGKCDVEENNDLAVQFKIRNVPTILFLRNGDVVDKVVGAVSREEIKRKLDKLFE
ncbi:MULTISPECIES: thioredoxin [Bacteroides]|jgi:thioredoxin 1|uniref:thioredoxin n=1 Tax=Bacteroides TaxID=816 RepID=UPI0006C37A67|nr:MULTISPECIES: thioredoxin [Bacteroides]DAO85564.1 MAG TPA: thioredoxin [Caudoviricetes sp.]MCM0194023.1 thioredoxin [Bacteroides fragilis]MCM0201373.1 thioredoxin [Bacteroides fragilis]MCM0211942.1 thioredoxin [Bacteroides fragilis]MCM0216471.1 thioredoxin [Bacteroides fragilis]